MALSFVTDKSGMDLLKAPFEQIRLPLRDRFDSLLMEDSLSSEQMKVYLRVRPFTEAERKEKEDQNCFSIESQHTILTRAPVESFTFKNSVHGMGKVNHKYSFNSIMGPECSQIDVFNKVVRGPVKEFLEGRNALVFTYGITSSGKTYTIQGPSHSIGILPRALDIIFNTIGSKTPENIGNSILAPENFDDVVKMNNKDFDTILKNKEELLGFQNSAELLDPRTGQFIPVGDNDGLSVGSHESGESSSTVAHFSRLAQILAEANTREVDATKLDIDLKNDMRFSIWVSYAEIYNECIYDLFVPLTSRKNLSKNSNLASIFGQSKGIRRPTLELRMDKRGSIYIRGLRCFPVTSADDAYRLLLVGRQNQQMACTRLNLTSSRSHTIFSVYAVRCSGKSQPRFARVSTLNFCDLAGSERTIKTQNVGDRLREAGNINTSLLTLGRCIQTLRNNQLNPDRPQLVPYRESKLTRLFQSFFTGKGKACMLVNINQCSSMFDETLHVLKFSAVAKQVVVQQNVQPMAPIHHRNITEEDARRSRYRSLGLRTPKPGKRVSIAWENTPRSCASPSVGISSVLFTGGDGTLIEEHIENTMTSIVEETVMEYDTEELLSIIEDLKNQLIESKKECVRIESKVRDEVCREMDELVLRLESQHEEALREQEAFMQEQSERRIQLYLNSVRKTKKRARIMQPEEFDGEEADDDLAEALVLRSRIEELESELSDLRSQCADQREALSHVTRERDEQTLAVTRLQFKAGLSDRETAQKLAKDEEKIRELEVQLQKMMSQTKDESHISDIDCQNDQSRLMLVSKNAIPSDGDSQNVASTVKSFNSPSVVLAQQVKKKVFSPVLPKRQSDEVIKETQTLPSTNESIVKSNVFSPVLSSQESGESVCDETSISSNRHYEDSCVSFTIPPTPKTVIKKNPEVLAKENEKLINQLNQMQKDLVEAMAARKAAETSISDLRTELTNVTAGIGSFLRHETETELEEALDQKRKEVESLTNRLQETESALRELERRSVANHDAFTHEQELRKELSSRCEQLEAECRRHIEELQRERRQREEMQTKEKAERSILTKKLHDAMLDMETKDKLYKEVNECLKKLQSENREILARQKAHEISSCKEKEAYEKKIESTLAEAKRDRNSLKSKIKNLELSLVESNVTSEKNLKRIDSLVTERQELVQKLNEARQRTKEEVALELTNLKTCVKRLESDVTNLTSEKRKLERKCQHLQEMESRLEIERKRNEELDASVLKMRDQLNSMNAKYKTVKTNSLNDESRIQSLKSEVHQLLSDKMTAKEACNQLQNKVKAFESEEKVLKKALRTKDDELRITVEKLKKSESDMKQVLQERNILNTKCSDYEKQVNELKEKENFEPANERPHSSKVRAQTVSDGHVKCTGADDDLGSRALTSRRVTRSMRHK